MKKIIVSLICPLLFPLLAFAEPIELPVVKKGDSWVYRLTTEKEPNVWVQQFTEYTVMLSDTSSILLGMREKDSQQELKGELVGRDWSKARSVNGKEKIVNQPFQFPLEPGKSWKVQYTELHPNKVHRREQFRHNYTVIGWEEVDVGAGHFLAIKVESEGKWKAELEPSVSDPGERPERRNVPGEDPRSREANLKVVSGRLYKAFWYVPKVKRWVKSIEEYYNAEGICNERYTSELEWFKVQ